MKFDWKLDDGGDWQLHVNGHYFGMACPHREWFTKPVAIWGNNHSHVADTIDEAKQILVNVAREDEYEEEIEGRSYPICC